MKYNTEKKKKCWMLRKKTNAEKVMRANADDDKYCSGNEGSQVDNVASPPVKRPKKYAP
jgi:hypothetical protein